MYECSACMTAEVRRGSWVLWNWSDGWWVSCRVGTGSQTLPLQEQSVALNHGAITPAFLPKENPYLCTYTSNTTMWSQSLIRKNEEKKFFVKIFN